MCLASSSHTTPSPLTSSCLQVRKLREEQHLQHQFQTQAHFQQQCMMMTMANRAREAQEIEQRENEFKRREALKLLDKQKHEACAAALYISC